MIPFLAFLLQVILISVSGVMAPGPMMAVTIGKGMEHPRAGIWVAVGHGLVEFPLIFLVYLGIGHLVKSQQIRSGIAFAGGLALLWMAIAMFKATRRNQEKQGKTSASPLLSGVAFSMGNPYFLVWWATIGAALVAQATQFGVWGFLAFAVVHWLCDAAWCYALSNASYRGRRFFGDGFRKGVYAVCGAFLILFSIKFLYEGLRSLNF